MYSDFLMRGEGGWGRSNALASFDVSTTNTADNLQSLGKTAATGSPNLLSFEEEDCYRYLMKVYRIIEVNQFGNACDSSLIACLQ